MKNYRHPATVHPTGNLSVDFGHSAEDYDLNVAPFLPEDLNSRIVDIGCGWGQFLWWLHTRGYQSIEGVDLGAEQVQACQSLGLTATQVTDSTEYLLGRAAQFDLITMHHIIEHLEVPQALQLLRAAYYALRPGGRIIVQTPNMNATSASFSRYIELTHVTGYTDCSLDEALLLAGFTDVRIRGNKTAFHFNPRRLLWLALQRTSRLLWRAMLFAEMGSDTSRILTKNLYAVGIRPGLTK
jgi:SAM-dependent methyltransferase